MNTLNQKKMSYKHFHSTINLDQIFLHSCQNIRDSKSSNYATVSMETSFYHVYKNLDNDTIFQFSKFCYKIFKYRKAFHNHIDYYID
jgi:hypothetical protein